MNHRYGVWLAAFSLLTLPLLGAQEGKEKARKARGYLGVQIQDVTSKIEKRYKLPTDEGAYVAEVVEDSPAEKAGLQEDDVVLSFGGKAVYDAGDLTRFVERTAPDTKVDVVVWRDETRKTVPVTVGKRKERSFAFFSPRVGGEAMVWSGRSTYGLELSTLNEQLGSYFGVPKGEGVLVERVTKESASAKAGLLAGDVITKVGKEPVTTTGDVIRELSDYEAGDKVDLEVYRKGSKKTVTVEVEEGDEDGYGFFFDGPGDGAMRIDIPHPKVRVHIDKLRRERWEDAEYKLQEALEGVNRKEFRIQKHAPQFKVFGGRITI